MRLVNTHRQETVKDHRIHQSQLHLLQQYLQILTVNNIDANLAWHKRGEKRRVQQFTLEHLQLEAFFDTNILQLWVKVSLQLSICLAKF